MNLAELHDTMMNGPTLRQATESAIALGKHILHERLTHGAGWLPEVPGAVRRQLQICTSMAMLWRDAADVFPGNVERQLWEQVDRAGERKTILELCEDMLDAHAAVREMESNRLISMSERIQAYSRSALVALQVDRAAHKQGVKVPL